MEGNIRASETDAMFMNDSDALRDRKQFVRNLGDLLSQTREGILGAELDDHEIVTVSFRDGYKERVNVNHDSYMAIIVDVVHHL